MSCKRASGFTVVELLFAMSFLSVLLIIAMISSVTIMRTYSKGITLKQVNQSGRAIGAELQRSLKLAQPPIEETTVEKGRLCLGTYSFIWSTGGQDPYIYDDGTPIGFAKVSDATRAICSSTTARPVVPKATAVDLLASDANSLMIQKASLEAAPSQSGYYLYTFNFTIGTNDSSLLNDERSACKAGDGKEFCALNAFSITASAKGL